jgi:predicted DCC family thiol-disulfide oxidoreductase YuxK
VDVLRRIDRGDRLAIAPLQDASARPADAPPVAALLEAIHVRDAGGRWTSGGIACLLISREVPILRPLGLLASLPPLGWLAEIGYRLVARNRDRLGRRLGLESCAAAERGPR